MLVGIIAGAYLLCTVCFLALWLLCIHDGVSGL